MCDPSRCQNPTPIPSGLVSSPNIWQWDIFVNDHVAWAHRLWETLRSLSMRMRVRSVEIRLRTFQPVGLDMIERRKQLIFVANFKSLQLKQTVKQVAHKVVVKDPLVRAKTCKAVSKSIVCQTWWSLVLQTPLQRTRMQVKVDEVLMREQHISWRLAAQIVTGSQKPAGVNGAYLFRYCFLPEIIIT